jgi:hypothetical protein
VVAVVVAALLVGAVVAKAAVTARLPMMRAASRNNGARFARVRLRVGKV